MCGIAGFTWRDEGLIHAMTDSLRHRGPDDEGAWLDDELSLGHRRLSIIDLSPLGHQPMVHEHGGRRFVISFNGEIFNYRQVRGELADLGHVFRSGSDTEVILAAYAQWGPDCVRRFNGMWAFALYDPGQTQLFLSRDRFGEKPLHYRLDGRHIVFASEIKAILAHPIARRANRRIVPDYLYKAEANGSLDSFFDGIRMLPAAHNAVFDLRSRGLTLDCYYRPRRGNLRVTPEVFRATLRDSVERRLVSDVPISISLSGGTDSTSVAALTASLTPARVKAFTTATEGGVEGNETRLIGRFLERYPQFELASSSLSGASFCRHYREIIYHMDEPFARQSAYVRWEIARLTHDHGLKVLLNGEGADEVLGGYLGFAPQFLADLLRRMRLFRFGREFLATLTHPERQRLLAAIRSGLPGAGPSDAQVIGFKRLKQKFRIAVDPLEAPGAARLSIKDFLEDWVYASSLPRLLVCNDKMSMANSVEGRAPFLDHDFVDLAFSMSPDDLICGGLRKYPLRDAMRELVPAEILFRKNKDTFNAPIFGYLRSPELQARVREVFRDARTAAVFSPAAYLEDYQAFLAGRGGDRTFLLHGLFLEEWARTFDVAFD